MTTTDGGKKKNCSSTTRFRVSVRTCVSMTYNDVDEHMFIEYRHDKSVPFLRIFTFVLLSLPISFPISLIVTMFVMEVPLPVLMLWAIGLSPWGATDGDVGTG